MKRNNIFKGVAGLAVTALLSACSSDYLQLAPETSIASNQVTESTTAAALAINGMCAAMQCQYQSTDYNQVNGESFINSTFGESFGPDFINGLWISSMGTVSYRWESINNFRWWGNSLPWMYFYNLINQANGVINGIDDAEGEEAERQFIKAQALTFRAHGYIRVLQYYAPRWEDSNNGEDYVAPMRVEQGTDNIELSKMNDILNLVYSDLNTAIELYKESGMEREYKWQPDLCIAQGLLARAAMIKHDWTTAQKMAHDARQGYNVMNANTYLSGFLTDNDELMWIQASDESDIYYWSWGSHYAANGQYVKNWGVGGGAINLDLYRQLDENDIRRQCYLTPDKIKVLPSAQNPAKITEADFWDATLVDGSKLCDMSGGAFKRDRENPDKKWGVYNVALYYSKYYLENVYKGSMNTIPNPDGTGSYMAYYTQDQKGDVLLAKGVYGTLVTIPLGAHYKFFSNAPFGTSSYPFMRGAEMCLTEAEAAYMAGDITTAQKCLAEVQSKRITGYSGCTLTGNALLEAIRLDRRIELWGEGFSFTDFKRWNIPMERRAWVAGDPTSGNCQPEAAVNIPVDFNDGWRFAVPSTESEYNSLIDRSKLPF